LNDNIFEREGVYTETMAKIKKARTSIFICRGKKVTKKKRERERRNNKKIGYTPYITNLNSGIVEIIHSSS
jgi:hypothetical protein